MIINTDYKSFLTNKYFSKKITKKYNSSAFTTVIDHERINNNLGNWEETLDKKQTLRHLKPNPLGTIPSQDSEEI